MKDSYCSIASECMKIKVRKSIIKGFLRQTNYNHYFRNIIVFAWQIHYQSCPVDNQHTWRNQVNWYKLFRDNMDLTHIHLHLHKPDCFCQRKSDNPTHKDIDNQAKTKKNISLFRWKIKFWKFHQVRRAFVYLFSRLYELLKALICPKNSISIGFEYIVFWMRKLLNTYFTGFWIRLSRYAMSSRTT